MKVRVGTLKRLIREAVNQMKLSVASANPPGEAWGLKDEPEPEVDRPYIARPEEDRPEDLMDPNALAWYTGKLGHGDTDMAGDPMTQPDLGLDEPFADTEPEMPAVSTTPARRLNKRAG